MSTRSAILICCVAVIITAVIPIHRFISCWGWNLFCTEFPVSDIRYFNGKVMFKVIDGNSSRWVDVKLKDDGSDIGFRWMPSDHTSVVFEGRSWIGYDAEHAIIVCGFKEDDLAWQKKVGEWRQKRHKEMEDEKKANAPRRVLPDGR